METTTRTARSRARRIAAGPEKSPEMKADPTTEVQDFKPITAEEQAIAARVAADSTREWETIGEDSAIDYSLGRDMFELPEPARKAQQKKRYAFRWVTRTAARIDQIRNMAIPMKWWICNSTNTPFLSEHLDPVLGCVVREDQILVFKPWWMHAKSRDMTAEVTREKGRDLTRLDGQRKGDSGVSFVAGQRQMGEGTPLRQEVKGGDVMVFDEGTQDGGGGQDLGALIDTE